MNKTRCVQGPSDNIEAAIGGAAVASPAVAPPLSQRLAALQQHGVEGGAADERRHGVRRQCPRQLSQRPEQLLPQASRSLADQAQGTQALGRWDGQAFIYIYMNYITSHVI